MKKINVNNDEKQKYLGIGSLEEKSKEQKSTSSVEKFQSNLKGEKEPKKGIKRKFFPNDDLSSERTRQFKILNKIKENPKEKENRLGGIFGQIKKSENYEKENKVMKKGKFKSRPKSTIDCQQHFEKRKKNFKANFKSKYSKAGKAAQRKCGQKRK